MAPVLPALPATDLPRRPVLRPGLLVVRRDERHLQVGVDPPHRVVLPDEPDVRRLLDDLVGGTLPRPTTLAAHRALAELVGAGLVVDLAAAPPGDRAGSRVRVEAPADLGDPVRRLLEASRCAPARPGERAEVALVIADGEVRREAVDELVRSELPHLVVSSSTHGFRIGPFVAPGRTACLRCVDAHLGELDPRRAMVLEQVTRSRTVTGPRPRDAALQSLVTAWAVRDVVRFVDGLLPSTWSASIEIGSGLLPEHRSWLRHPHCGCAWGADLDVG